MHEVDENQLMVLAYEAAQQASIALSTLAGQRVLVTLGQVARSNDQIIMPFPIEGNICIVELNIKGDVLGVGSIIFQKEMALTLADCLTKRELSSHQTLDELSVSALNEVGNIIMGSFLTVMANRLQLNLVEDLPQFQEITASLLLTTLEAFVRQEKAHEVWNVNLIFRFSGLEIQGSLLLLFRIQQVKKIIDAINSMDEKSV